MWIDISSDTRICLNANKADRLTLDQAGSSKRPVYFVGGVPLACTNTFVYQEEVRDVSNLAANKIVQLHDEANNNIYPVTTLDAIHGSDALRADFVLKQGDTMTGPLTATKFIGPLQGNADSATKLKTARTISLTGDVTGSASFDGSKNISISTSANLSKYLPLTAGSSKKLTGPLGLTSGVMYGPTLPSSGFDGQLFFLEDSGAAALPTGGSSGWALVKNSATDGDASWKSSSISWAAGTSAGPQPKIFGVTGTAIPAASGSASGVVTTGTQTFAGAKTFSSSVTFANTTMNTVGDNSAFGDANIAGAFVIQGLNGNTNLSFKQYGGNNIANITYNGSNLTSSVAFYGAVWNDYAEFRTQKEVIKPGYCVASADNGQVYKTTEKFQACDGIVSDTFGFAIGETDDCKTPLAVAGRVLAYFHGNREDYNAGDTVCAGPEGKVMKMTREEIKEYPDRIIGIVSEIPEYETWGSGNVAVNERIWIKVR